MTLVINIFIHLRLKVIKLRQSYDEKFTLKYIILTFLSIEIVG